MGYLRRYMLGINDVMGTERNKLCNVYQIEIINVMCPLLWREIPMAWGTTTNSLTPEINPFQYEIEIKYLTLKDQTSYLIPDG